ncbi:hypothetical protein [Nonomuraea typhae]|uniref:hypothetical protein n=1 Tax=Nonomuraea typhae TaxID=2603600 RepID=UPI0012FBDA1E|nr:hypothetical protein [Nonomuraea typhae]
MSVIKRTAFTLAAGSLFLVGLGAASASASAAAPCTGRSGLTIMAKGETQGKAWADVLNCGRTGLVTLDISWGPDPLCREIRNGVTARITAPTAVGSVRKAKYC